MTPSSSAPTSGLEGVIVARTVLSEVDGEAGRLLIRGLPVEELASRPFPTVASHLWSGLSPVDGDSSPDDVAASLGLARASTFAHLSEVPGLLEAAARLPILDGLRSCLAILVPGPEESEHRRLTAALPTVLAALVRTRGGHAPVAPDPSLDPAADLLRMLSGTPADAALVLALQTYLATICDHGMNASTFTARVVASTAAPMRACVLAAIGALEGPLHGGAPGPVLDMLDSIGSPDRIETWVEEELASGRRLMGFGHRVYRVRDPRAEVLRAAASRLSASRDDPRLALAAAVEERAVAILERAKPGRRIQTNVEFYTAVLLDAIGLDRSLFTAVFAAGRILGWIAHVLEQRREGRLIRPRSEYVGPRPA